MSDLDNAIKSINESAAKAENTAGFLDDMSTLDDQSSVTNPNNGQTVASIPKQVKDRTDELFAAAESDINQAVSDAAQSATDAQDAADSIGRYQGLWPDTGGSALKGDTYQTQVSGIPTGQYFTALQNTTVDPVGDDVNWREVVSIKGLSQYTDIVYKASGGKTAIENMIGSSPMTLKVGDIARAGGTEWRVTSETKQIQLDNGLYVENITRDIYLSTLSSVSPDASLTIALGIMKENPKTKIFVDGNFSFSGNYTVDHYLYMSSILNSGSMRFIGNGEFMRLTSGASGSVVTDIDFSGNDFNGNPFNGKTLLSVRVDDANDMSQIVQKLKFDNLRFQWCNLALFLGHAGSSSFDNLRAINVVNGIQIFGVCLENSFYRPNILAHRCAVEFKRNSSTAPQGSGDVPQGNYFVNGTLVLQGADALRDYGGFTDATINSNTATIKTDCLFDYGFTNTWIENNLRHSTDTQARLGYIIDYVQDESDKYFQGAISLSRCRVIGGKIRLSGGAATSFADGGVQGSVFTGCDIAFLRDDIGNFGFDINNYTAHVSIRSNRITVKSGNKRIATFSKVRGMSFSGNDVAYEDDIANTYPSGPSIASESPIFLFNTERVNIKSNDFNYTTSSFVDFVTLQGSNTDYRINQNSSPLDDLLYTDADVDFYRKNGVVKVVFRTTTGSYTNGQVIASLPAWLEIKNPDEITYQQTSEYMVYGDLVTDYSRIVYSNGDLVFFGSGVNNMRSSFSYDLF